MSKAHAARLYPAAVKPVNAAELAWNAAARSGATPVAAAPSADALAQALVTSDSRLLRLALAYPPAASDLRALVNADARAEGDLRSVIAQNAATLPGWTQQMGQDNAKSATAADAVRADLGLPPPSP